MTYHIACATCMKHLWIGQGNPGHEPDDRTIYFGEPDTTQKLRDFLYAHETTHETKHVLMFAALDCGLLDAYLKSPYEGTADR